jgi:hypothetical protein
VKLSQAGGNDGGGTERSARLRGTSGGGSCSPFSPAGSPITMCLDLMLLLTAPGSEDVRNLIAGAELECATQERHFFLDIVEFWLAAKLVAGYPADFAGFIDCGVSCPQRSRRSKVCKRLDHSLASFKSAVKILRLQSSVGDHCQSFHLRRQIITETEFMNELEYYLSMLICVVVAG